MTDNKESKNTDYPMAEPSTVPIATAPEATYASVSAPQPAVPVSADSIEYIPPIQYEVPNQDPNDFQVTELMIKTYQYSGSVRCLSIFEIAILLMYSLANPLAILLIIFPLNGYYGSINYDSYRTRVYFYYQIFACIINVVMMVLIIKDGKDEDVSKYFSFSLLNLCFNLYFAILIKTFLDCVNNLSHIELSTLKVIRFTGNSPIMYRYW